MGPLRLADFEMLRPRYCGEFTLESPFDPHGGPLRPATLPISVLWRFNAFMIRAIIFDFDGVIADTEPLHYDAFARVLAGRAAMPSHNEYYARYLGLNDAAFVRAVFTKQDITLRESELRDILAKKNAEYERRIAGGLPLLPGVAGFIGRAKDRYPLAVCSGARRVEIEAILHAANLRDAFLAIVSADDVSASKPDPMGFLMAAERLRSTTAGLIPGDCLVIEDSANGIKAARAAGMKVVRVRTYATGPDCPVANIEVDTLNDLTDDALAVLAKS